MFWKLFKPSSPPADASQPGEANDSTSSVPLDELRKFIPIGELPESELKILPIQRRAFSPGQIVFKRGECSDSLIYLLSGSIFLESASGSGYTVDEKRFIAYHPLSTHTEHLFSGIAKSNCEIICLPRSTLQCCVKESFINNPLINAEDVPADLANSNLFSGFCEAFRRDQLKVPALPNIAVSLRRALQKEVKNVRDIVKITNLDPVVTSKLIQVANSPLYRPVHPISNSRDAINRLGFKGTQNVVTSISLHHLFHSDNQLLNSLVQKIWKKSVQVAALSYTLAGLTDTIDPDESLLAGLTFSIGALPIVTYAESLKNTPYSEDELDRTISVLQGLVGEFILKQWNFPDYLQSVPRQAAYWYHDEQPTLQISDIVLLARFHAQLGDSQREKLPPLNTLPAFSKLGNNALSPDLSLEALQKAKQQIAEAIGFFRTAS
ncbi:MAG: HDOD domain-containing protein [Gammaproteobacteria bacterium]